MEPPLPLVTSQARLESDVLDPQPGLTAGSRHMFQALGGPDRYPAVPSVARYSIRALVLRLLSSQATRPLRGPHQLGAR